MSESAGIAAGVVLYHPDLTHVARLIKVIAPEVNLILLYENSPLDAEVISKFTTMAGNTTVVVLGSKQNEGLGIAYNAFVSESQSRNCELLVVFDQDSLPRLGMIGQLVALHNDLVSSGESPAIVGPQPVDEQGSFMRLSLDRYDNYASAFHAVPALFVISSGSLIDLAAARQVGIFREDYFIDAIDIEWCLRARAHGFSIWVGKTILMDHRLGSGLIRLPFGLLITKQPIFRIYMYIRNQMSLIRLAHVPWRYRTRFMLSLPVRIPIYMIQERFSLRIIHAIALGIFDGLRNRLGPPRV